MVTRRFTTSIAITTLVLSAAIGESSLADTFGSGANTFDIEFVTIGNPGNAADTTGNPNPAGSVPYTYRMGKFEISEQMIDKANAVGGLGITKDTRGADKPATSVSWNEAARFVNWLNTSTGSTPAYKFAIQPGEVGYNANANIRTVDDPATPATTRTISTATAWRGISCPASTSGTRRRTTTRPAASITTIQQGATAHPRPWPAARRLARQFTVSPSATGPADITLAGGLSPYGTMGQGGNVYEWEETDFDLVNGPTPVRLLAGFAAATGVSDSVDLSSSSRGSDVPTDEDQHHWFSRRKYP